MNLKTILMGTPCHAAMNAASMLTPAERAAKIAELDALMRANPEAAEAEAKANEAGFINRFLYK